ncbi:MAG TPA: hypothetical protein VGS19_03630 [Streptosporangiaceae bacterium]|nr:hypothetical protein [Streptosporangiaceae bacterium]
MSVGVNLYPWDVVGDPEAAPLVASLGADQVTLAAAYHATRALTPRHPGHRVVLAPDAAVYYPPGGQRWRGRRLRPAPAGWMPTPDSFTAAATQLRACGLAVNAWAVLLHNSRLGAANPDLTVVNAYGDHYPWALCPAQAEVREYAACLSAEVAALPQVDAIELEACGWYGFDHLSSHDKTGGVRLSGQARYLFSLCFCPACARAYAAAGIDAGRLRDLVQAALDPVFAGTAPTVEGAGQPVAGQTDWVTSALGTELAAHVLATRSVLASVLRAEVIAAVRAASPGLPVLLHGHPDPRRCDASPGADPAAVLEVADGLVVPCRGTPADAAETVGRTAAAAKPGHRIAASLVAVSAMGGHPDLASLATRVLAAGATELRLYHAGLASATDLAAMRSVTAALKTLR